VNLRSTLPVIVPIYSCEIFVVEVFSHIAHPVSRRSTVLGKLDAKEVGFARNTEVSVSQMISSPSLLTHF